MKTATFPGILYYLHTFRYWKIASPNVKVTVFTRMLYCDSSYILIESTLKQFFSDYVTAENSSDHQKEGKLTTNYRMYNY